MDVHVHARTVNSCNFRAWEQSADLPHGYFVGGRLNVVARDREYTASAYRRHVLHVVSAAWHTQCCHSQVPLSFRFAFFSPTGPPRGLEVSLETLEGRFHGVRRGTVVEKSLTREHLVPSTKIEKLLDEMERLTHLCRDQTKGMNRRKGRFRTAADRKHPADRRPQLYLIAGTSAGKAEAKRYSEVFAIRNELLSVRHSTLAQFQIWGF